MFTRIGEDRRELTPEESEHVNDVLDAAVEWEAGRLPFEDAMRIGLMRNPKGDPSPEWTRGLAFRFVPGSDPRKPALYKLSEEGSRRFGKVITPWGMFDRHEIMSNEFYIRRMRKAGDL